jgi:CRISPR system Cascade subunit CasE
MHAAVLAAFPQTDAERGRVLWRVDRNEHQYWLYVVSGPQPDFAHIVEQAGWQTTQDSWTVRPYAPLLERLRTGQQWRFRVTANPTRASRAERFKDGEFIAPSTNDERSKRHAHVTTAQQLQWLLDRAQNWGFAVPESDSAFAVNIVDRRLDRFKRGGQTVTISKATFDGVLSVSDPDALRHAMTAGIGPAKAYGCGLLTLAPL